MSYTYRIRPAETWVQARDDYLGGLSAETVCRIHDLGLSAFRRRAKKYGWRRMDQNGDPAAEGDLSIYDDIGPDEKVETARLRFIQSLEHGKAVEAQRWRRLWHELRAEADAFDEDFFRGMTPEEIAKCRAQLANEDDDEDETEEEALLLGAPAP